MKQSPEAFNDAVRIVRRLAPEMGGISRFEVQRVAYLACLLALYDGQPLSDWGYSFIRADFGTPFSGELSSALDWLAERSLVPLSQRGRFDWPAEPSPLNVFLSDRLDSRSRYLLAACDSALLLPASTIADGIDAEPTSQSAAIHDRSRPLLSNVAQTLLYEQIEAIRQVVGQTAGDLLTPSLLWMTYSAGQPISRRVGERS